MHQFVSPYVSGSGLIVGTVSLTQNAENKLMVGLLDVGLPVCRTKNKVIYDADPFAQVTVIRRI